MKPFDPRTIARLAPARISLAGAMGSTVANSVLVVAQAFALTSLVVAVVRGDSLVESATWLAVIVAARAVVSWAGDLLAARAAGTVGVAVRDEVLRAALALDSTQRSRRRTGELSALATRGATAVEPYVTRYLPALALAAVLPALTVVAIASQDLIAAGIVVATLPLIPIFAALIGIATKEKSDRQWRVLSSLSGHFLDVMKGLPTLVAFRRAEAQSRSIREITHRYRVATMETLKVAFASSVALELVATLSVALVAVVVGLRLQQGSLDLSTALVVLLLAPEAYWPLRRVGAEFHSAAEGISTFEEVLALEEAVADDEEGVVPRSLAISVEELTVTYPGRAHPALSAVSERFPSPGVTAITGPSGSGKSTLLAAVLGDVQPSSGRVLVGGVPLEEIDRSWWRDQVAVVPQRPWIFSGTVRENLLIAEPAADDDALWSALERVHLAPLVREIGGLDTVVTEDGASLSAGQRARLALARAVLADRPVVVLDEPTAHLDAETEAVILDTLTDLGRDRCVLVVAHRPEILARATHHTPLAADPSSRVALGRRVAPHVTGHLSSAPEADAAADSVPPTHARSRLALGALLGALASTSGVALMATSGWLITRAAEQPPVLFLMAAIVGVRTFGLARPVFRYAERLVSHDVALRLLAERRAAVYDALVPLVPGRLGRQRGDVLAAVVDDVDALVDRQLRVRTPLLTWVVVTFLVGAIGYLLEPVSALVLVFALVGAGVVGLLTARLGAARNEQRAIAARADVSTEVTRLLQGAGEIRAWRAEQPFLDAVENAGLRWSRAATRSAGASALARSWVLIACGAATLVVALRVADLVSSGDLRGPVAALLVLVPLALVDVLLPVTDAGALAVRADSADARIEALVSSAPAVTSPRHPKELAEPSPALALEGAAAGWGDEQVFDPLDVTLPPGRRLGVVGPSGSGKSTLVAVLLRFIDPQTGQYRIGGETAPELALDDVRRTVGLVDDDPHIFGSTVFENVRLARPDADVDEVEAALDAARLGEWLDSLPHGLDTRIGEGADAVSGGERARIALARALLADPAVLVLDEPTAHLDADTALAVTDSILASNPDRTLVWVTHGTIGLDEMDEVLDLTR